MLPFRGVIALSDKISHLKDNELVNIEKNKITELSLPNGAGKIVSYHPFESMQILFFDLHSPAIPDLWQLGFRKGDNGRYLRTLICKRGECDFTVNGVTNTLYSGHVMMDYDIGDKKNFAFTCENFSGVEITMQVDTLVNESAMLRMLRIVVEEMCLPEEEIFESDGYIFSYSKSTEQTLDKLLASGLNGAEGVMLIALTVEIGHNLGTDLKKNSKENNTETAQKQLLIAEDIYRCLTDDFGTKHTATHFAKKYGTSDTTVKKYFKNIYGYGFKEYQTKVRMEWAAEKLATTDMKVGDISDSVGYAKHTKFSNAFKKYYGMTPLAYRRKNLRS